MYGDEQDARGLKRDADSGSDESGPSSRKYFRGERERIESFDGPMREIRLLIASKSAGAVIGKSGSNIKRLREEFKARVSVPDSSGPERVLSVEASPATLAALLDDVFKSLMRDESNRTMRKPGCVDIRLLVHQSQAGCIIGRGGQKIKELREQSGLEKLSVYPDCAPRSTDRIAQFVGEPEKIVPVVLEIYALFDAAPPKGPINNYNPSNAEEGDPEQYGGWPGSSTSSGPARGPPRREGGRGGRDRDGKRGGSPSREGGYPPGAPFGMPPYGMWGGSQWGGAGGGSGGGWAGMSGFPSGAFGMGGFGGGGPGFGGGAGIAGPAPGFGMMGGPGSELGPGGGPPGAAGGDVTDTQVSIPNALTGCIMGKGGERIKQIRRESGGEITISKEDGSKDRIITIRGTREQIQLAQYLLQTCVKKYGGGKY